MILSEQDAHVRQMASSPRWMLRPQGRAAIIALADAYEEMFSLVRESRSYLLLVDTGSFPDQASTARLLGRWRHRLRRRLRKWTTRQVDDIARPAALCGIRE